jgi:hypothetical protein
MSVTLQKDDRLVFAILAEQVSAMRERMDASTTFDLLWRTSTLLSWLSGLLGELARNNHNPVLEKERSEAVAEIAGIRRSLDELFFFQAQRSDFARQVADCVVIALGRVASEKAPLKTHFSTHDLEGLYVSSEQRDIHNAVIKKYS